MIELYFSGCKNEPDTSLKHNSEFYLCRIFCLQQFILLVPIVFSCNAFMNLYLQRAI